MVVSQDSDRLFWSFRRGNAPRLAAVMPDSAANMKVRPLQSVSSLFLQSV